MPATTGRKRGRIAPAPRLSPLAVRSAALGGTTRGGGLRHHPAVDHRQAVAGPLVHADGMLRALVAVGHVVAHGLEIGRGSCRERVCQDVEIWVFAVYLKKK